MNTAPTGLPQDIEFLNHGFGNSRIEFFQVTDTLLKVELRFSKRSRAEIHLQGAHLTRWVDVWGRDNIFNSPAALYQEGVPIRGGNPVIFPQFGAGDICQHGFARNSLWRVIRTETSNDSTVLCLQLTPKDVALHYREQWPHNFIITLTVSLGESLITELKVINPNSYPLQFTHGFHTYLAVDDIHQVEISDFSGLDYMDNLRNHAIFRENREKVLISEFIDRRYQKIPDTLTLHDKSSGRLILMKTKNCRDAFVWNPWQEAEKKLADLTPQSYQKFVCIEPGNMKKAIALGSKQTFVSEQEIHRVDY